MPNNSTNNVTVGKEKYRQTEIFCIRFLRAQGSWVRRTKAKAEMGRGRYLPKVRLSITLLAITVETNNRGDQ